MRALLACIVAAGALAGCATGPYYGYGYDAPYGYPSYGYYDYGTPYYATPNYGYAPYGYGPSYWYGGPSIGFDYYSGRRDWGHDWHGSHRQDWHGAHGPSSGDAHREAWRGGTHDAWRGGTREGRRNDAGHPGGDGARNPWRQPSAGIQGRAAGPGRSDEVEVRAAAPRERPGPSGEIASGGGGRRSGVNRAAPAARRQAPPAEHDQ